MLETEVFLADKPAEQFSVLANKTAAFFNDATMCQIQRATDGIQAKTITKLIVLQSGRHMEFKRKRQQ